MNARSPKAALEPGVLEWLRASAGYSRAEAAKRISTKEDNLVAWELGKSQPSMSQVRNLAQAFKRPISDFFLPAPVEENRIPHDFRRLPEQGGSRYSPALLHELRLAHRRRLIAIDFADELGFPAPTFGKLGSITLADDPEKVGGDVRAALGATLAEQLQWRDARVGYNNWRLKIEAKGVLVFQVTTVIKAQMLGFSLVYEVMPVIAVNRKLKPNGRTFTLLHELTHLLLGESGICDIDENVLRPPQEQRVEAFCNHVAGAALVPRSALLDHKLVRGTAGAVEWSNDVLKALARDFSVSMHVILRRLHIAGRTTQAFYNSKYQELNAILAQHEQQEQQQPDDFKRNMPQEAVSNLGRYARLVIDSYSADAISLSEASKLLGVKAEKVAAVGDLLR